MKLVNVEKRYSIILSFVTDRTQETDIAFFFFLPRICATFLALSVSPRTVHPRSQKVDINELNLRIKSLQTNLYRNNRQAWEKDHCFRIVEQRKKVILSEITYHRLSGSHASYYLRLFLPEQVSHQCRYSTVKHSKKGAIFISWKEGWAWRYMHHNRLRGHLVEQKL